MSNEGKSESGFYTKAGVDITRGYESVRLIEKLAKGTVDARGDKAGFGVLGGLGGFAGLFAPDLQGLKKPVLVSGTDGVGTKLKIAFALNKHDTIGIDCVAMCVNDVLCAGAAPLFFLDYIALGKNEPEKVAQIVKGVAAGCVEAGCALLGGETAEMPGMYEGGEYDIAGFAVGLTDEERLLSAKSVAAGDVLIALPSSGVHSNGFSLVRKILQDAKIPYTHTIDGATLGETLLTPTKIYARAVLPLIEKGLVKSMAHITGGGFYENIPRALPAGLAAKIDKKALKTPPIFDFLQKTGGIPERDMFNVFNMGVGLFIAASKDNADAVLALLSNEGAYIAGEVCALQNDLRVVL